MDNRNLHVLELEIEKEKLKQKLEGYKNHGEIILNDKARRGILIIAVVLAALSTVTVIYPLIF